METFGFKYTGNVADEENPKVEWGWWKSQMQENIMDLGCDENQGYPWAKEFKPEPRLQAGRQPCSNKARPKEKGMVLGGLSACL